MEKFFEKDIGFVLVFCEGKCRNSQTRLQHGIWFWPQATSKGRWMIEVETWHNALMGVALLNLGLWALTIRRLHQSAEVLPEDVFRTRRWMLLFSSLYVLGCGFRSLFPVVDVPRIALVDSLFSSIAIGRSVATIAELSLIAQGALLLNEVARQTQSAWAVRVSWWMVPLIALAEACSWYAVLTLNHLSAVFEESLWGLTGLLVLLACVEVRNRVCAENRLLFSVLIGSLALYVAFMALVDVPMYFERWQLDELAGGNYLTVVEGWRDATSRLHFTAEATLWQPEMAWISLYFSVAVWFSIALVNVPNLRPQRARSFARARGVVA